MEIEILDPTDSNAFQTWYETYLAAEVYQRRWATPNSRLEKYVQLTWPDPKNKTIALVAKENGQVIGAAQLDFPLLDNLDHSYLAVFSLLPNYRSPGYGAELIAKIDQLVLANRRLQLGAWLAYDLDTDPRANPLIRLLLANGFKHVLTEYQSGLDLPVTPSEIPDIGDYQLISFTNTAPPQFQLGLNTLSATLGIEAPSGLSYETELITTETETDRLARVAEEDRCELTTIAVSASEVAGYTRLSVPFRDGFVYQDDTLVAPSHRGHRLGMAMKIKNLIELQQRFSQKRSVRTWNAEENSAMLAINTALGFRRLECLAELIKIFPGSSTPTS